MTSDKLDKLEYNPYYETYIKKTSSVPLKEGLRNNFKSTISFLKEIPNDKLEFRYAVDKWTVKEVILHMIDTERIFTYRALRIAREDQTPLPGFDQDNYVLPSNANKRTFESLLEEYQAVRMATITLFDSFEDNVLLATGTASNSKISVRALGFIIIGHENHHLEIIKERYLNFQSNCYDK